MSSASCGRSLLNSSRKRLNFRCRACRLAAGGRFCLRCSVHALVPTILLRFSGFDQVGQDAIVPTTPTASTSAPGWWWQTARRYRCVFGWAARIPMNSRVKTGLASTALVESSPGNPAGSGCSRRSR